MSNQGTPEWHQERAGKFTGSRFVDVLARNKKDGKPLKAYHDLIWDVAVERLTGIQEEGPTGFALQWGKDVEPFAREAYEFESGNLVTESGFIVHPKYPFCGCSPDGLIGDKGGVEIKSPKSSKIHLARFIEGMPEEYRPQVQGCMWVTGREFWDFVSYDPRMPAAHRLFLVRVYRDEPYIAQLEAAVLEAEDKVQELIKQLGEIKHAA